MNKFILNWVGFIIGGLVWERFIDVECFFNEVVGGLWG